LLITDPEQPQRVLRHYRADGFEPRDLERGLMPPHPTLFLRRAVYARCGGYEPGYRIAGDFELCLRVFLKARVVYRHIPEALVRMPAGGLSNRGLRSVLGNTREIHAACAANGIETSWLKLFGRLPVKWFRGRVKTADAL
jgi:hypothetical protein